MSSLLFWNDPGLPRWPRLGAILGFTLFALTSWLGNGALALDTDLPGEVRQLIKSRCVLCHGPSKQEAALNLAVPAGMVRGGDSGPSLVPGELDQSLIWQRVNADEMPPDAPLSPTEKETFRRWIASGAPGLPQNVSARPEGDEHWAFQALRPVNLPELRDESRVRRTLDRFVQARLESAGLSLGPAAERNSLIRRVSFDLTGLPPTPDEIETYLADRSSYAYEDMVDRYLHSHHYGERWGKYWLDAAGYADSNGYFSFDTDRASAYRYRDYVIRALNRDTPWDQFIRDQLAGDELVGYYEGGPITEEMIDSLEAVHFLRNAPDGTDSSDGNPDELRVDRYAVLDGSLQIMGSSLLGITVQCSRCHDHKFEPLSHLDYYQLQATLYPAFNVDDWVTPGQRIINAGLAEDANRWQAESDAIDARLKARRWEFRQWYMQNGEPSRILFLDDFDEPDARVSDHWTTIVPGDSEPAGIPPVNVDSSTEPSARIATGSLELVGTNNDDVVRVLSSRATYDWTPQEEGQWIQVTFDLVPGEQDSSYSGLLLSLGDFNDKIEGQGGNILFEGSDSHSQQVAYDYPGEDSHKRRSIGDADNRPGRCYGVRVTNIGDGRFQVAQVVNGLVDKGDDVYSADELPDGAFGFKCGKVSTLTVDNVMVESGTQGNDRDELLAELVPLHDHQTTKLNDDLAAIEAERPRNPTHLAVVCDLSGDAPSVPLLQRGNPKTPGDPVFGGAPAFLSDDLGSFGEVDVPDANSTGRRTALARWLTSPASRAEGLFARVTVNRWWQKHFGTGIVRTVDNLGYSGNPPSHPSMLEFLAGLLVESGWSAKEVHREILLSATYRQRSEVDEQVMELDPDNRLLSRFPLMRLDAEAIRDGMLAVSGQLDGSMYGPYVDTRTDAEGDVVVGEDDPGAHRRSVYLQQRRTQVTGMLAVFDAPSLVTNCTVRTPTTVPLQSLKLLNAEFIRTRATNLRDRIRREAGESPQARMRLAWVLCAGREPSGDDAKSSLEFIESQPNRYPDVENATELAWVDFCQMLLASNAFLYIQ